MTQLAIKIIREVIKTVRDHMDPEIMLVIDYPQEDECIDSMNYSFRIGAGSKLKDIEISISGDSWHPCRPCQGYWWYDWHSYRPGPKYILVRATTPTGEKVITSRRFTVHAR